MRVMANAAGWGDSLWVDSCGVSDEEEGNPMDRRAVATLLSHGIRPAPHEARRFSKADYAAFDDILCMEERNRRGLLRLLGILRGCISVCMVIKTGVIIFVTHTDASFLVFMLTVYRQIVK